MPGPSRAEEEHSRRILERLGDAVQPVTPVEPTFEPIDIEPVYWVARCSDHGLHGQRDRCHECGKPVDQVGMIPVEDLAAGRGLHVIPLGILADELRDRLRAEGTPERPTSTTIPTTDGGEGEMCDRCGQWIPEGKVHINLGAIVKGSTCGEVDANPPDPSLPAEPHGGFEAAARAQVGAPTPETMALAELVARAFHETYERLAPRHGYVTREESAVPWAEVPEANRATMVGTALELLESGAIYVGASALEAYLRHGPLAPPSHDPARPGAPSAHRGTPSERPAPGADVEGRGPSEGFQVMGADVPGLEIAERSESARGPERMMPQELADALERRAQEMAMLARSVSEFGPAPEMVEDLKRDAGISTARSPNAVELVVADVVRFLDARQADGIDFPYDSRPLRRLRKLAEELHEGLE